MVATAPTMNPHYTPGMGFKTHAPPPPRQLDKVVAEVRCGDVKLKLTLTSKFLARPLRAALIEPFLKAHNKKVAEPVEWEHIKCVKVSLDGSECAETVANPCAPCESILTGPSAIVQLLTSVPESCLESWVDAASTKRAFSPYVPVEERGVGNVTGPLLRAAVAAANTDSAPLDGDTARRCRSAFEAVAGAEGGALLSLADVRRAFLEDEVVRSQCFLAGGGSPHAACLDASIGRMSIAYGPAAGEMGAEGGGADATADAPKTVSVDDFTRFFAAISAAACAPPNAAQDDPPPVPADGDGSRTGNDFLDQLLNDDGVKSRRIA